MNYFDPYRCLPDQTTISAWDSQVAEIARKPQLAEVFAKSDSEILPRFAARYAELRALPRSARRALQRQVARSSELAALLPEWLQSQGGRALQHKLARSLAGAAFLLALGQGTTEAATINVTTNNPNVRVGSRCSLIAAIVNANADAQVYPNCPAGSGADTIVLPANATLTLGIVNNKTYGPTGLPVITSPITIEGNGAKFVRRNNKLLNKWRPFRLIAVGNTGELTLQDVTLSGGNSHGNGGAIENFGTLAIENSTISGNTANPGNGGGISNAGGTIAIRNSTISGNTTGQSGGAVNNDSGVLTIENSAISENASQWGGGGVENILGTVSIENSTISNNTAGGGGGVDNGNGTVTIENSIISGNHAVYSGGGIFNYGAVDVTGSTISGNSAIWGGGAFNTWSYSSPKTLNITNSTISGNVASDDGGGIFNFRSGCYYGYYGVSCYSGGDLSLADSTITQNQAGDSGGGLFNEGTLSMTNSTISNNQAPVGPDTFP